MQIVESGRAKAAEKPQSKTLRARWRCTNSDRFWTAAVLSALLSRRFLTNQHFQSHQTGTSNLDAMPQPCQRYLSFRESIVANLHRSCGRVIGRHLCLFRDRCARPIVRGGGKALVLSAAPNPCAAEGTDRQPGAVSHRRVPAGCAGTK